MGKAIGKDDWMKGWDNVNIPHYALVRNVRRTADNEAIEEILKEAAPALNQIAKEYNLQLGLLSDFKIARAIWAKSLKRVNYD